MNENLIQPPIIAAISLKSFGFFGFFIFIQKIKAHYLCIVILAPKIIFLLPLFLVQLTRPTDQCAAFECSIKNWRKFGHSTK